MNKTFETINKQKLLSLLETEYNSIIENNTFSSMLRADFKKIDTMLKIKNQIDSLNIPSEIIFNDFYIFENILTLIYNDKEVKIEIE